MNRDPAVRQIANAPVQTPLESGSRQVTGSRVKRPLSIDDEIGLGPSPSTQASGGRDRDVEVPAVLDGQREIRIEATEILANAVQIGPYVHEERSERDLDAGSRQLSQRRRLRRHLERYRSDESHAIHEGERVARRRQELLVGRTRQRFRQRGNQLFQRDGPTVSDKMPEDVRGRRHKKDVARLRMEDDPVFRVVVVSPDQVRRRTPSLLVVSDSRTRIRLTTPRSSP